MPKYEFKLGPETAWFLIVAVATAVLQAISAQGAVAPPNMQQWIIGVAVAAVRAGLGALLSLSTAPQPQAPAPPAAAA